MNPEGITPAQQAEQLFTECVLAVSKIENLEERQAKFQEQKNMATAIIDLNLNHWLLTKAEWENILNVTSQKNAEHFKQDLDE
jgi:hypothetical protein